MILFMQEQIKKKCKFHLFIKVNRGTSKDEYMERTIFYIPFSLCCISFFNQSKSK